MIDSICMCFVLQMGPHPATIDPKSGHKTLQIEKFCLKSAGQAKKRGLNALFSMTSVSHKTSGTSLGQQRDTEQVGTKQCPPEMIGRAKGRNMSIQMIEWLLLFRSRFRLDQRVVGYRRFLFRIRRRIAKRHRLNDRSARSHT